MGEEKRIRPAVIGARRTGGCQQGAETISGRQGGIVGGADQSLRDQPGVDTGDASQRARHQQPADADAEAAADQLDQQEALGRIQLVGMAAQRRQHVFGRTAAQRQQPVFDPVGQPHGRFAVRRRQQVGDRLGEIADGLVALLEQPLRQAGGGHGERPQFARAHHLSRLAAGEEVHRPGGVAGFGLAEVACHRLDLGLGRRALVEFGEQPCKALHAALAPCSASSPYSVANASARRPCSLSQRTSTST